MSRNAIYRRTGTRVVSSQQFADVGVYQEDGEFGVLVRDDSELELTYPDITLVKPIYVGDFKQLCLYLNYVQATSDRMFFKIYGALQKAGPYHVFPQLGEAVGNQVPLKPLEIIINDGSDPYLYQFPNSNLNWMKLLVKVEGTVTGTSCETYLARGWGN